MANRLINQMGLPRSIANIFAARNINTAKSEFVMSPIEWDSLFWVLFPGSEALSLTEFELMELLDVGLSDVASAVAHISEIASPPYQTALSLMEQRLQNEHLAGHLSTCLKGLDEALFGGIPFGVLTELVGPAGIGKTQFCLKLSFLAALPPSYGGLDGRVIYIDVESKFSSRSFPDVFNKKDMAKEMAGRILVLRPASLSEFTERNKGKWAREMKEGNAGLGELNGGPSSLLGLGEVLIGKIQRGKGAEFCGVTSGLTLSLRDRRSSIRIAIVVVCFDFSFHFLFLHKIKVSLLEQEVKLVIIDSMAALITGEYELGAPKQHSLGWHISFIKSIAEFARIPVVVTNQVRSRNRKEVSHYSFQGRSRSESQEYSSGYDSHLVAALGVHWAHSVTIRLVLEVKSGQRFIKLAKSPMSPPLAFPFTITPSGVSLLTNNGEELSGAEINEIHCQG
ncbi:DNA repair protein RAD51-like protein 2 isoform X1 [Cucumis melo var. makuwa]|uniref:DNA repair protein RAD51-like protein 2 isoform X1 n=1 Tax=Cucumis melo var. makuwa TaxID=1194695 RepID=A0A5D3CRX3_CUCMM|nr:DNA repair protein RAD51-like protein 2 isoform X1 [Cucumis melo var. makuwa]